jgi:hypothetical protein
MVHVLYVSAMLVIRNVNTREVPVAFRPRFAWRVFERENPARFVEVISTRSWGALRDGAQRLGVEPDACEVEVMASRTRDF